MRYSNTAPVRLIALMLALVLCMVGCGGKKTNPEATVPETTAPTAPSAPVTPTEPTEPTPQDRVRAYLKENGKVTVETDTFTFVMRSDNGKLVWEYQKDVTNITIILTEGAATQPVTIKFDVYDAEAEVDVASYSAADGQLINFRCYVPSMTETVRGLATSLVQTCFLQAESVLEPTGVTLTDLGFVNYYE